MAADKPTAEPPAEARAEARHAAEPYPFGPAFFEAHLGSLVRDRCPDPAEARPVVRLHLLGGDVLDVCHVIGLAPQYVALAVHEEADRRIRTEIVPYVTIVRVTISADRHESGIGFVERTPPALLSESASPTAEGLLEAAATPPVG
jgi:hypothetical protein